MPTDYVHELYEGREKVADVLFAKTPQGVQLYVKTRTNAEFVPLLALVGVGGRVAFALNGPRVQTGKLDAAGAIEDE